jgi:hypothetical protein
MAKKVIEGSDKVSASQLKDFFRQIEEGGITGNHIQAILERRNPFAETLEAKQNSSVRQFFQLEIDGTKTLEQMIADGKYDWKNSDINEKNFPIKDKTKRTATIELFHFVKDISSENAIKAMAKEDFRPATIEELLALGAKQPELQKEFPIIALGSVWRLPFGLRGVPGLYWSDSGRELNLASGMAIGMATIGSLVSANNS